MKICDCVKDAVWYDPRVRKQIDEYIECGHSVVAVGVQDFRYNQTEIEKMPCTVYLAKVNCNLYKNPNFFQKVYREIKTNIDIYKLIVSTKPDIIHANDLNALIPAYYASKKLKCGIIYDTHEIFLENPWVVRNKLSRLSWSFFEKRIIRHVDLVVSVSHVAAEYLKKKYKLKKILVVTNCVSKKTIIKNSTPATPLQVLNHGQFYEGRGYDILVDVAPLITELSNVQIALRGYGRLEQEIRKRVAEKNIRNFVFFPPVKVYELIPAASTAWVGIAITEDISLNFKLSVSNKLFEYAAAGLPIIMSGIPEHVYLNEKYHIGIILKSNSPEDIAEAIKKMYYDKSFYQECKENVYKMSMEVNWEKEFSRLISFEKTLLND